PRLVQSSRASDSGGNSPLLRDMRLRFILEAYIDLLAQTKAPASAAEAFALADVIRGQAVQHALSESAARVSVRDPALADLVRREQDARSQINALFALIANIQAVPTDQRDEKAPAALRAQVDQLRGSRAKLREEIEKRFPDYANLIDPRPVDIEQVRKVLRPDEAIVTFYLGENRSFVWAVPASGAPAFAAVPLSATKVAEEVQMLRRALEPNASTLAEIPAFDTDRAYRLYQALLQPVESGWRSKKSLLVVPHGALGELPLALLPTAPSKPGPAGALPFAEYQKVPWLVRQVAVTQLPSATSLVTLRTLPAGNASRRAFLGFGDPWFNEAEAKEAQAQGAGSGTVIASRGAVGKGLHIVLRAAPKTETAATATVASLPRLPETADEVRNVAIALRADPNADVFLGAKANEEAVRTADLGNRRVVMFATHGLVPGDLDGLQEPALALSAPSVAHIQGDGLLTMSKILGLKLDADWVVLSACNTAAGSGAGAEAVSGLGRAFFYAGTRALLVSNWPVETTSARTLTTDLFRRQAEQPGLSRAEALRQAELALIDGPGFVADGKPLFSYAHPIFWAPFAVIGDGGGN
ncbi:MAG: CHAT domain-containing protein, partial [Stellaceae bacterium]